MGNRGVITINGKDGIYLHWNGGRDSVEAFLLYAKLKCVRFNDYTYGLARLTQIICNFFGGTTSVGTGRLDDLDCNNFDNGLYIINQNWEIAKREYFEGDEQQEYNIYRFLKSIDVKQPLNDRLFKGLTNLKAIEKKTKSMLKDLEKTNQWS